MSAARLSPHPDEAPAATERSRGTRVARGRLALLALGGLALVMGLWTGLARAGVHALVGPVGAHGIIMVLGFLGTLIALERAVALRARWAYAGPALSGAAAVWLITPLPATGAGVLLTAGGGVVAAVYGVTLARRYEQHLALMAAGAVAWVVAAARWTAGWSVVRLAPMLAAFLVLTIVGERLELSRLRMPSAAAQRRLVAAAALFAVGVATTLVVRVPGLVLAGLGLLAQTAWLARHDVARVTIHRPGLPRYAAACLLGGYVWLAAGGVLWIALGTGVGGPLMYDAALHALFLGFVISMVMGHAPIIVPAVLSTPLPHRAAAWVPLGLLHASVALRVGADLAGSVRRRGWAVHGNVTALLLFVTLAAWAVRQGRAAATGPHHLAPTPGTQGARG